MLFAKITMAQKRLLIIEDEQFLLETLQLKLGREGFIIDAAQDGEAGLAKAQTTHPDVILLDLLLPKMKGEEVLSALQKNETTKNIPVLIISNSGQPVEIERLLKLGARDYIIKADFTIDDILDRIHNLLVPAEQRPDVLVAEDEEFLRTILSQKLRKAGWQVTTTMDGDATLKSILERKPKLVLLDLLMGGLSGIEVLRQLKEAAYDMKQTKILVLSNYSGKENEPIIKEMTQGYYIKSNVDIDDIVDTVKKQLSVNP